MHGVLAWGLVRVLGEVNHSVQTTKYLESGDFSFHNDTTPTLQGTVWGICKCLELPEGQKDWIVLPVERMI